MTDVTVSGKSVQEALQSALKSLNTTEDNVKVEVIEEPKRGFLGLLGSKPATIKVSLIEASRDSNALVEEQQRPEDTNVNQPIVDPIEKTTEYLRNIIKEMDIDVDIQVIKQDNRNVEMKLTGDKIGILIGKRGQTLNAFQYLANIIANQYSTNNLRIVLDAEDYRERRKEALLQLAERTAEKVQRTGRRVSLEPMPSYERKIIHSALQRNKFVKTGSEGKEPKRFVVVELKS